MVNTVIESDGPFEVSALLPLREQISEMPYLESYTARDGKRLQFRRYAATCKNHIVLVHGSSSHSAYCHAFAKYLAESNAANVYAVDLRGHGVNPERRGDIDYIGQLEDDLADLFTHIQKESPDAEKLVIGGHSSGGGLSLRFAGGKYGTMVQGVLLLAPYLGHKAPMVKRNAGGWVTPNIPKIIGLSILNGLGIKFLIGTKVLRFNLPEKYRTGCETLEYSFRLMKAMHPKSFQMALVNTKCRVLLIVGIRDEAYRTIEFKRKILKYKPDAQIYFVDGATHLGIIMSKGAMVEAAKWIRES